MRVLAAALCLSLAATSALAQDGQFRNGTPIDYTKPFLFDGWLIRPPAEDTALPVEVIGRAELIQQGNPTMDKLVRQLKEVGLVQSRSKDGRPAAGIGVSSLNLRNLGGGGVQKIPPAETVAPEDFRITAADRSLDAPASRNDPPQHCYFSTGEPIDLESRAISCRGELFVRTPSNPGP